MFDATGSSLNGFKILPADDTCSVNRRLDDQMIYDEDSSPGESVCTWSLAIMFAHLGSLSSFITKTP
jgi:hypothetical protein